MLDRFDDDHHGSIGKLFGRVQKYKIVVSEHGQVQRSVVLNVGNFCVGVDIFQYFVGTYVVVLTLVVVYDGGNLYVVLIPYNSTSK